MNNKNCFEEAQKHGVTLKAIYQRRWLQKNKDKWNEYKRKIYRSKKECKGIFTPHDLQLLHKMN